MQDNYQHRKKDCKFIYRTNRKIAQGLFIICTFYAFRFIATETRVHHCTQLVNWVFPASEHPSPSFSPSSPPIMVWPVNWGLEPSRHSNITKANNGREWNECDKMKRCLPKERADQEKPGIKSVTMYFNTPTQETHLRHVMITLKNYIVPNSNVTMTKSNIHHVIYS